MTSRNHLYVIYALFGALSSCTAAFAEPATETLAVQSAETPDLAAPNKALTRSFTQHLAHTKHTQSTKKPKEWTILIYIQACNNLESFAHRNLKAMLNVGSNDRVNILVELHKSGDKSWRYRIDKGTCVVDEVVARSPRANPGQEVVDSMRWATSERYKAEKYALIFWNHGIGVIDPSWSVVEPYYMKQPGMWRGVDVNDKEAVSRATTKKIANERGILFDDERRNYLTNPNLKTALRTISTELLGGKKLEVVGMDACLMGMIEIPYQFKEYAKHFVASEEFEFAQGWAYGPLVEKVAAQSMDGKQFCKAVVDTFHDFYSRKTNYYTQSAINVERLDEMRNNVNNVSLLMLACIQKDRTGMKHLIKQARDRCLSFSVPDYIDLHSFYHELHDLVEKALNTPASAAMSKSPPKVDRLLLQNLKSNLDLGRKLITGVAFGSQKQEGIVTANTAGKFLSRAKGMAIYFPQNVIDDSYIKTEFAKNCSWFDFLVEQVHKK